MSILVAFLLLAGCIQNPADKENDLGKTYKVDFSALSSWSDADTFKFDKATGRLTVSEIYTGGEIWLSSFDASDYNYLEIKILTQNAQHSNHVIEHSYIMTYSESTFIGFLMHKSP